MRKKTGVFMVFSGVVLILSALLFLLSERCQADTAEREAARVLCELERVLSAKGTELAVEREEASSEMPVVCIDGYDYIGCLEIPFLELELPVMAEWDSRRLRIAPCRQCGTLNESNLVIAAHNYRAHFGKLKMLPIGELVRFTDVNGGVTDYSVVATDTIDPYDVDTVLNSAYDLVLYTCTKGGKTRVAVFCNRVAVP